MELNRRKFIKSAGAVLGLLALRGSTTGLAEESHWTPVGSESDFPIDTPVYLDEYLAHVIRRENRVEALSARCTHRGCTVNWSDSEFVCPCHQARFSVDGTVVEGPARDPLTAIPAKSEDGQVWLEV